MKLSAWLGTIGRNTPRMRRRVRSRRLRAESLERRAMLTTFFVEEGAAGGTGAPTEPFGTIQEAVDAAAAAPGPDQVAVQPGTYGENIVIDDSAAVTIRGLGEVTIEAADPDEDVIRVEGGDVTLRNLKVTGGDDGIDATGDSLTLHDVEVTGNADEGLGAEEIGRVVIHGGDFSNNGDDGVAVEDAGSVNIIGGTFSGSEDGDGIDLEEVGTVYLLNVVASGNADEGLEIDDVGSVRVVGSLFVDNNDEGMDIDNSGVIQVVNVASRGNGGNGLQVEAGGATISSLSVVNGRFEDNDEDGVEVVESDGGLVERLRLFNLVARDNDEKGFEIDVSGDVLLRHLVSQDNGEADVLP